jgi:hypothetical protein
MGHWRKPHVRLVAIVKRRRIRVDPDAPVQIVEGIGGHTLGWETVMTMRLLRTLALFAIVAAGCGSGDSGGSGGGTFACTNVSGTSPTCFEIYASNATASGIASAKGDCTNGGGVASDICPRAGADGACQMDDSQTGATATVTTWYYAGNAASEMQACLGGGDTWIAP